jgi:hypothetical protein
MEQRIERLEQTTTRHDEQIATLFSKVDDGKKYSWDEATTNWIEVTE